MYDARALANYFIDRSLSSGPPLTVMTLLKVLYFSHAWYLANFEKPLVAQPFEAWKYGPVCRVIYEQFKGVGEGTIDTKAVSLNVTNAKFQVTTYEFDSELAVYLNNIFDYYSAFHPFKLSDLTHELGSPWDIIWNQAKERAIPGMVIPNDLIAAWFKERDSRYWTYSEQIRET